MKPNLNTTVHPHQNSIEDHFYCQGDRMIKCGKMAFFDQVFLLFHFCLDLLLLINVTNCQWPNYCQSSIYSKSNYGVDIRRRIS